MNPFVFIVLAIVLLAVFYFLFRRAPAPPSDPKARGSDNEDTFVFDPMQDAVKPFTRRKATITAPAQNVGGVMRKLTVSANPLPAYSQLEIPQEKKIDALVVLVGDFRVSYADTGTEVNDFTEPLTFVFEYTKEDAATTGLNADGSPQLSIVTGYPAGDGWKFEKLLTKAVPNPDTGGGTLTATVRTLHPLDPQWIGRP